MTTATRPTSPDGRPRTPSSNGHGRVSAPTVTPPKRRVRLPELAISVVLIVLFALGAFMWHLSTSAKVPALAANAEVKRGDIVELADLRTVYVASDDTFARVADPSKVVGKVALVDIASGTILSPSLVAEGQSLTAGYGVVGLALDPGQYPALGLAPGDRVNVVRSGDSAPTGTSGATDQVIARGATVFSVEDLASDRKLVSIQTAEADADAVAAAAGPGGLRLVLVSP